MVKFAVAIPLLIYYVAMTLFFTFSGTVYNNYDTSDFNNFYDTQDNFSENSSFDWLDYGISLLAFLGVGFTPDADLPTAFQFMFSAWCIIINVIAILVVIQIIRGS